MAKNVSWLDQKWLKSFGINMENDEVLIILFLGYGILRFYGYV